MLTYYLLAHPETVVAISKTGKLPDKLPERFKIKDFFCNQAIRNCFSGNTEPLHQTFIIELRIPPSNAIASNSIHLQAIQTEWIHQFIVYSQRANKLLNRLLNTAYSKPIIINPAVYPQAIAERNNANQKAPHNGEFKASEVNRSKKAVQQPSKNTGARAALPENSKTARPTKRLRIEQASSSSGFWAPANHAKEEKSLGAAIIQRITTYDEHIELLQAAFREAKKSILISSFNLNHETFEQAKLYQLIPQAQARGVRIYIYYNDKKFINRHITRFLNEYNVTFDVAYTHSKIVAVDKSLVATGSCNWLSIINKNYEPSEEASFIIRGQVCEPLIEEFWKYIKYYRNKQFGNNKLVRHFERDNNNFASALFSLNENSTLNYIPTLDQHCGFLQHCFERAQQRVIICSPFISSAGGYEKDISLELLLESLFRGIEIYFVCSADSPALEQFNAYLNSLNLPRLHLIPMRNLHLKTIIVDNNMIAEGSFNWLSASRNDESNYHNHEQTLVVEGKMAQPLIAHFLASKVGTAISKISSQQVNIPQAAAASVASAAVAAAYYPNFSHRRL